MESIANYSIRPKDNTNYGMSAQAISDVVLNGDLSRLTDEQRLNYYNSTCESLGLNPLTKPFAFIKLNGKLTMYALKDCTEQLRKIHGVSITSVTSQQIGDVFVVTAQACDRSGKMDSSTGAVPIKGISGEALANALMKAETKAKRRVTLSICGLGMLDETELETIPSTNHSKDFQQFAPQSGIEMLQNLITENSKYLTDKEIEYYDNRIDLTLRGVVRESKGNRAATFAYSAAQMERDMLDLKELIKERRREAEDDSAKVAESWSVGGAGQEELEAMLEIIEWDIPDSFKQRLQVYIDQIASGEIVSRDIIQNAIEKCKEIKQ